MRHPSVISHIQNWPCSGRDPLLDSRFRGAGADLLRRAGLPASSGLDLRTARQLLLPSGPS
jgi:hypothetical protein